MENTNSISTEDLAEKNKDQPNQLQGKNIRMVEYIQK